jgi:hypothetical protein
LVVVALSPLDPSSRALEEVVGRRGQRVLGRCLVVENVGNALAVLDKLSELNAKDLVVVGVRKRGRPSGIYLSRVGPLRSLGVDDVVRTLWPNLTGSLELNHLVEALRILYDREFLVAECEPGGNVECGELVEAWLRRLCQS